MMIVGSMVALVTPMTPTGEVDYPALGQLVDWHVEAGTRAIVAVGTTGESATLNVAEHCKVIEHVVKQSAGKLAVIAGTGANSTSEAIELTRAAKRVGADACLSVTPYYNKPSQEGLYLHHKAIAEAVDIPNILYNVPGRTAVDMLPETTFRLAEVANIVGIKDATGDLSRGIELINGSGADFAVYSGDDATAAELMMLGGKGDISVTANVVPEAIAQLSEMAIAVGENAESADSEALKKQVLALNASLMPLHDAMFLQSNPIPVMWALYNAGRIGSGIRLPLTELEPQYHAQVEQAYTQFVAQYAPA